MSRSIGDVIDQAALVLEHACAAFVDAVEHGEHRRASAIAAGLLAPRSGTTPEPPPQHRRLRRRTRANAGRRAP